ncbi:MAG: autotransporter outer membrane beta-barrel domain-containing protein, partial [Stellaceae bacterium]
MAHSIDDVCPNVTSLPTPTPAQVKLGTACSSMTGTAVVLQGGSNPGNLPSLPLDLNGLKSALTQLNGGSVTIVPTTQASVLRNLQSNVVLSRLSLMRVRMLGGGMASDDAARTTLLAMGNDPAASDANGSILVAQNAPTEVSIWSGRLSLYLNGLGQFGDAGTTGSQSGYSFDSEGFVLGGDYSLTPKLSIGLSFGYTHSNSDFDVTPQSPPGQFLRGDLLQGSLYALWYATDQLYLSAIASIGGGDNDSQRQIAISGLAPATETGSFGTRTYGLAVGGGYMIPMGALTLTPTARVEYRRLTSDAFTENGSSGLELTYGGAAENEVLTFIGGQVQYAISTGFGVVTPTLRGEWAHQYNSGNTVISVAYANDPTFSTVTLAGTQPSRNYGDIGVGVALQFQGNWSSFINYDAIVGVANTTFNSFTAGVRFGF